MGFKIFYEPVVVNTPKAAARRERRRKVQPRTVSATEHQQLLERFERMTRGRRTPARQPMKSTKRIGYDFKNGPMPYVHPGLAYSKFKPRNWFRMLDPVATAANYTRHNLIEGRGGKPGQLTPRQQRRVNRKAKLHTEAVLKEALRAK